MQPSTTNSASSARSLELRRRLSAPGSISLEACEPRLVLSAQLLSDLVDPWQLHHHGLLGSHYAPPADLNLPSIDIGSAPGVEPQTANAHQQTGWNAVQQEFGLKGTGQTVAVIDSGIAWDHLALGKGFGAGYRVVGGWDFAENDSNPYDDGPTGFHGTHVSGIIGSDSPQTPGVATDVDLVGLRVFNDAGQGNLQWVEQALNWVHQNRNAFANPITTVNLSLGSAWNSDTIPGWATLEDELKQLYNDGIVVTASAGNAFKTYNAPGLSYPAASSYVLPVASVDDNGSLSDFSQRSGRVLAAPGRGIMSTVPDHVLGRDGRVNDFSTATGTSMASPYVAGASVLVREAMQMVGIQDITPGRIFDWLHQTADTVYDSVTRASYDRLDLQNAIDTLIPDDTIGNSSSQAQPLSLASRSLDGWINHLGDTDLYRFTAEQSGRLTIDADSQWLEGLQWKLTSGDQTLGSASLAPQSLAIEAGRTYELSVSADQEIGPFQFKLAFQANQTPPGTPAPTPNPTPGPATDLGTVDYLSREVSSGSLYRAVADNDGIFTVQWNNPDAASGVLAVRDAAGVWHNDATWTDGKLRLDLNATAGQAFDILLPGTKSDVGQLTIVDLVQLRGSELLVHDTAGQDQVAIDLNNRVALNVGSLQYDFQTSQISRISISGAANSDSLQVVGSALADKVEMKLGSFTLENTQLVLSATLMETVHFDSGLGVEDRLAMFDSEGDDILTVNSDRAELTGLGFKFSVANMDRYLVNATGQGQDVAFMYDSTADDHLSVRPQFTSLSSDKYFVSVRGFERVFVYANAGGRDTADLYDSAGDDRFATSGDSASIVGPGFHSSTKYFEQVHAHASAGGRDVAQLFGSNQQTQWLRGSDFVSFNEGVWSRNAQGFERTEAFVNGLAQSIPDASSIQSQTLAPISLSSIDDGTSLPAPPLQTNSDLATLPMSSEASWPGYQPVMTTRYEDANSSESMSIQPAQDLSLPAIDSVELASQLLMEVAELKEFAQVAAAEEQLKFHRDPAAERRLLDQIFADLG